MKLRGNPLLHFVDRYVGIPAVLCLGALRRKRTLPLNLKTIGLLRTGAIGDTVLLSAVIADLKCAFPHCTLILFCNESNLEMARMLEGLDCIIEVPLGKPSRGFAAVRSVAVDVLIDFGQWSRLEALLAKASKSSFAIGFRTSGQCRHAGYDLAVEHSATVHELENYRQLVRPLGVRTHNLPFLKVPAVDAQEHQFVVCHPWPGGRRKELKEWPADRWVQLIEEFARWGLQVVLTGAPADRASNESLIKGLRSSSCRLVKNAAGLSLRETAQLLAGSRLVVCVNTGVMHMAAALGVPLVALHGPTSAKRWGPTGDSATIVESPLDGCGYLNLGWEYPAEPPACMQCISFEDVRDASQELLAKRGLATGALVRASIDGVLDQSEAERIADRVRV